MSLKKLGQFIRRQGWSFFGITDYQTARQALKKHEKVFEKWFKKGMASDMKWLSRMKKDRYRPENKLPDIKSVIVLAAWYGKVEPFGVAQGKRQMCSSKHGRVARYAVGKDYHKVLKKKLLKLSDWLKQQNPGAKTYLSVDSGPTVDRVLAEAAGLGFFGKNSMVINPNRGSYFFIASLMTNIALPSTVRLQMPNCGVCTRCIDKCPTKAIVAPGVIDARKCIAYLTIENKGPIPLKLRLKIGNRIFGCDTCQEVCPFNLARAHKQKILIKELRPEYGTGESLDLNEVLAIKTDEEFLKRFAGTPLMRAKRNGLIRNAKAVVFNVIHRVVK